LIKFGGKYGSKQQIDIPGFCKEATIDDI